MERFDLNTIDTCSIIWFSPSISLATFYHGTFSFARLQERTAAVLQCNPWLAGRLKGSKGQHYVEYSTQPPSADCVLRSVQAPSDLFGADLEYSRLGQIMWPHCAQNGDWACNRDEPLFRVTVLRDSAANEADEDVVVLFSLCHVLGDASSLYQVLRLFNEDEPLRALKPARQHDRLDEMQRRVGGEEMGYLVLSGALFAGHVLHLLCNNKHCATVSLVDPEAVRREKKRWVPEKAQSGEVSDGEESKVVTMLDEVQVEANTEEQSGNRDSEAALVKPHGGDEVSFVSTNDLLLSWLARNINSTFCVMSVNMRSRLARADDAEPSRYWIGNYTSQILYRRGDYENPNDIRRSLSTLKRVNTYPQMPSFWETLVQAGFLVCTNWTGVYEPVRLPGCTFRRQLPVYPTVLLMHVAVVFRYADGPDDAPDGAGQTALLLVTHNRMSVTLHSDKDSGLLSEALL